MCEAEDEEVARVGALPEGVGDLLDVGVGHFLGGVGDGGIVGEGSNYGAGQRGSGGGGGSDGGGGGGDGDGLSGVDEGEEEGEGEDGDEGEGPDEAVGVALLLNVRVEEDEFCGVLHLLLSLSLLDSFSRVSCCGDLEGGV